MQSFNLTRFADPACCTVPKCWTPPTLPFHPPKTPRCINPLVEAKWAPAIVGSDQWNQQWRQDHGWHQWFPKQRTPKDPNPYEVHDSSHFHFKNKNSHEFLILSLSSLIAFTPTLDTLQVLLDISNPRIAKNTILKRLIDHICCVRSMINLISSKYYPVEDSRSYMITQSAESHLSHSKESIQQTLMLASIYIHKTDLQS